MPEQILNTDTGRPIVSDCFFSWLDSLSITALKALIALLTLLETLLTSTLDQISLLSGALSQDISLDGIAEVLLNGLLEPVTTLLDQIPMSSAGCTENIKIMRGITKGYDTVLKELRELKAKDIKRTAINLSVISKAAEFTALKEDISGIVDQVEKFLEEKERNALVVNRERANSNQQSLLSN